MHYLVQFFSWLMDWCHSWCPNHWTDIVLFTFLTKILQYPVSLWCQANSLKMVSLLPRTIRLKLDHYGDNDTIGEKTAELYKTEGYHPLLSLVPLAIQIVILIAFVRVIGDMATAPGAGAIGLIPATAGGWTWLMPLAAGASAWLLGLAQNRINPLQREQSRAAQWTTNGISIAISLFLGAFVGLGVGLYWVCSNLFSVLVQLACNWNMPPAKRVDYPALRAVQAELAKLEAGLRASAVVSPDDKKREKRDYKRFFSVANKHLVFYAEGGGYYRYFQSLVEWLLEHSTVTIHYITHDPRDAIFERAKTQPRIRPYFIGPVRIIPLMMKMDADMVVMTTPDLGTYQLKRSYVRKDVEYVYLDHAMSSMHMIYRKGAYNHFDTIFANGPHQIDEHRATETLYGLKPKKMVETGYVFLDTPLASFRPAPRDPLPPHIRPPRSLPPSRQHPRLLPRRPPPPSPRPRPRRPSPPPSPVRPPFSRQMARHRRTLRRPARHRPRRRLLQERLRLRSRHPRHRLVLHRLRIRLRHQTPCPLRRHPHEGSQPRLGENPLHPRQHLFPQPSRRLRRPRRPLPRPGHPRRLPRPPRPIRRPHRQDPPRQLLQPRPRRRSRRTLDPPVPHRQAEIQERKMTMPLAYIDPSVMSYTVQAIAGVAIALGVVFGVVWRKIKKGANKALGRDENANKEIEDDVAEK